MMGQVVESTLAINLLGENCNKNRTTLDLTPAAASAADPSDMREIITLGVADAYSKTGHPIKQASPSQTEESDLG